MIVRSRTTCSVIGLFLAFAAIPNSVQAEAQSAPAIQKVEFTTSVTGWLLSQGQTKWSHDFSRLTYKDTDTNIAELSAQATFARRWFIRGDFGYGTIGSGEFIDDDFSSANGPLELRTSSDLKGTSVWYVNGDVGVRLVNLSERRGGMGIFTGIQYWRQEYHAIGVTQVSCNPVTPLCTPANNGRDLAPGASAITNKTTWISWRVGIEGDYRFTRQFGVEGKVAFIPLASLNNEDIHHLRQTAGPVLPALQQDPSFRMTGTGIGADVDVSANYMIVPRLFLTLGYRFWWNYVVDGKFTSYPVGFPSTSINLNMFQTYRHGMTLGLRYAF